MPFTGEDDWAVPGVSRAQAVQPVVAQDVEVLTDAVEQVLAVDPAGLAGPGALDRAARLLVLQERLAAATLRAVADVEARDLWAYAHAGSTRTWLRTLPCGDTGQLAAARALEQAPLVAQALGGGLLGRRAAAGLVRVLGRVPQTVQEDQLQAVLVDGTADLLAVWTGSACCEPTAEQRAEFARRRSRLAAAVGAGLADSWSTPASRLEPVFVLAAQVLAPAQVEAGLALLVDALQPEADRDAAAEQGYRDRSLVLRKLRSGGWSLRAHLTDETGQLLAAELAARSHRHPLQTDVQPGGAPPGPHADDTHPAHDLHADPHTGTGTGTDTRTDTRTGTGTGTGTGTATETDTEAGAEAEVGRADVERFGAAGPGRPMGTTGPAVEGTPLPSTWQRDHDALAALLADLAAVPPGSGTPAPAHLTLTCRLDALRGRPGAPPALLHTTGTATGTATGPPVPLSPAALHRHACTSRLAAVLLDPDGRPVTATGTHRHATTRERRALHAAWGSTCAVNGCTLPGTVPHHVVPFHLSHQTRLADLAPLCQHHHHDVHEGRKTLRLRDDRLIDQHGWTTDDGWARR